MASTGSTSDQRSETRDKNGLCLLSLDGGGVRGLSTLLILKGIMQQINSTRQREGLQHVKPCDVFDLIGGTSTGGLIAIMLGRLQMDIQPCIDAYSELSRRVFSKKGLPVDLRGRIQGRFKASELENAIKDIVKASNLPVDEPLNDNKDRGCRAFVCAVRKENKAVAQLRAYHSDRTLVEDRALIWEAARATSAASGFFDSISIGKHGQEYVDAGLGCNNPVQEVWTEAQDIWSPGEGDLATLVKCFISIGTGDPGTSPIEDGVINMFTKTLEDIVTETEKTAETFVQSHRGLFSQGRYFRFNVDQGLQSVGLEEYKKEKEIVSATSRYMESQRMVSQVRSCSQAMKDKEFWKGDHAEMRRRILGECQSAPEQFRLPFSLAAAPAIDYFVGRRDDLSSIESVLFPINPTAQKIVVLHGLGGIGKSQLAIEYAKKHQDDYAAIFWLNAKTEDTLKESFADGARRLPKRYFNQQLLHGSQNKEALGIILQEMKAWFDLPGNYRWLIIFDNVDNPKLPDNKDPHAYDIRSYFPENYRGSILVTTRWKTLAIGRQYKVAKLSTAEDSISLLVQKSDRPLGEDPGIGDLLEKLDGLPLALATAGGFLGMTGISVSEYLLDYEASWLEIQETSPDLLSYEDKRIYSTWDLSYNHIRKEDESAAKLLEFWAYFDNQDLWYDLLKAGDSKRAPEWFRQIVGTKYAFRKAVVKLQKHALVELSEDSDGYSMHHCVHAWVKNVLSRTIEDQSMRLAIACVEATITEEIAHAWITKRRVLPHSARCLKLAREWDKEGRGENETCIAQFLGRVGWLHLDQGRLMEAETTILRAYELFETVYGSLHMFTLKTASHLAKLYDIQGRLNEAEPMYMQTLICFEQIFGPDDKNTLSTVGNLGMFYWKQGRSKDAESMSQRALNGFEKTLGPNHEYTFIALAVLGLVYATQDRLKEAESMYLRTLTGLEKLVGPEHEFTPDVVRNLGDLYSNQGKLKAAQSMYQRALSGFENMLVPDHECTLEMVFKLGTFYARQDRLKEAESMYLRALRGYTRNPPPNPKDLLHLYYNTGLLYQCMQNFEKAKEFFSQAYQGSQELWGSQHDNTIIVLIRVNIEMVRKEQPAAFASGVISMPVSEGTTEAEPWANIEKSVVEKTRVSCAVNTSRARQNDTESEETIESQVARISAVFRAQMAKRAERRQARANQPCE